MNTGVYIVLSGDRQEWSKGSETGPSFTVKRSANDEQTYGNFRGAALDGQKLNDRDYETKTGSLIFTLNTARAEKLSTGSHTLTLTFTDGEAEASFTVRAAKADKVPKTGDNASLLLWIGCVLAGLAIISVTVYFRKRK